MIPCFNIDYIHIITRRKQNESYARKKDLRQGVESGSAKWNEDLKGFCKAYTTMTALPQPKKDGFFYRNLVYPISTIPAFLRRKPILGAAADNMIMADGIYLSMNGRKTGRNSNVVCIGGAGTGKSYSLIKPNILQANCSMVITDPSGELLESMGTFLQEQGYEIKILIFRRRYNGVMEKCQKHNAASATSSGSRTTGSGYAGSHVL